MGCINSTVGDNKFASKKSSNLDKEIKKDNDKQKQEIKLLLLGAGESGKSTIAKQMKILHKNGYTEEELKGYIEVIWENIFNNTLMIVEILSPHVKEDDTETIDAMKKFISLVNDPDQKVLHEGRPICDVIKIILKKSAQYNISEEIDSSSINQSCKHYFESFTRISNPEYVPNLQDVLHSRVKTTGIIESVFSYKNYNFKMFDVGGQRSERRKWIHCFDGVTGLIFVSSMAEYNQHLIEDETTNRMHESLKLFASTCNSHWFKNTSIILFLNKKDLFAEKIVKYPLTICFPEFTGPQNYESTSSYIESKFEQCNNDPRKEIYTHMTCATDTDSVSFVFGAVSDTIIKNVLREYGLY